MFFYHKENETLFGQVGEILLEFLDDDGFLIVVST